MTAEHAIIGVIALLFLHAAARRWALQIRIERLEHCVFERIKSGDKLAGLKCRCTGKDYEP